MERQKELRRRRKRKVQLTKLRKRLEGVTEGKERARLLARLRKISPVVASELSPS